MSGGADVEGAVAAITLRGQKRRRHGVSVAVGRVSFCARVSQRRVLRAQTRWRAAAGMTFRKTLGDGMNASDMLTNGMVVEDVIVAGDAGVEDSISNKLGR